MIPLVIHPWNPANLAKARAGLQSAVNSHQRHTLAKDSRRNLAKIAAASAKLASAASQISADPKDRGGIGQPSTTRSLTRRMTWSPL